MTLRRKARAVRKAIPSDTIKPRDAANNAAAAKPMYPPTPSRIDERCVGPIRIVQLANGQAQFQQLYERVTYAPDGFQALEWTQEWRAVPVLVQAPT